MRRLANVLIFFGAVVLVLIFAPVIKEEARYYFRREKPLTPPNTDFSIVIPKISAAAPIIANVDASDPKIFLPALKRGVAHAKGTSLPDATGNTYLFAHSTDTFYNVGSYNAVFYLIGKLNKGDEIDIYYKDKQIKYQVYDKKVVGPNSSQYFGKIGEGKTLTLQTCYPPGTTLKRLIVIAKEVGS